MRLRRTAALLALVAACNTPAMQIRRTAEGGDVPRALRLYQAHVRERGASHPDALAGVALSVLRRAAASSDPRERAAGFASLRSLGARAREALDALRDTPGVVGDRALAALYDLDGREGAPPPRLVEAARSTDPERRIPGLAALEGRRDVDGLVAALDAVFTDVRRAAAYRLAHLRTPASTRALSLHATRDPDEQVRAACAIALAVHGEAAGDALEQALRDPQMTVRMVAVTSLAQAAPRRADALLAPMLGDEPSALALEAARALAQRNHAQASGYILSALGDARPEIRAQAAVAAATLGDAYLEQLAPHIEDADVEVRIRVAAIFARRDGHRQRVLQSLRPVAQRPDPLVAVRALGVLAEAGDPAAAAPLREALRSPEANVRRLAVLAWSRLAGNSAEVDPLAPLLEDPDRSVRLMAAAEIVRLAAR